MRKAKYTREENFQCLEDLRETSAELALIHMGRENCQPYHVYSGTREEYILHFVTAGHGFYSADGSTWSIGPGQVFLIHPRRPIVYCADSRDPWSYSWVGFRGNRSESILRQCGFTKTTLHLSLQDAEMNAVMDCFDEILTHVSLGFADCLFRESTLMKILSLLCKFRADSGAEEGARPVDGLQANAYAAQAVGYITTNYMHNISVSDIADCVGISRTHLNRVFREEYKQSVQSFLMEYRMHKAAGLLTETDKPVKEIAVTTGYTDPLYFSKVFKNRYGISPTEYRTREEEIELRGRRPQ